MTILQSIEAGTIPARLTVRDVYALQTAGLISEQDSFELVDGEIVPMAAAKSSPHEAMKSQLIRALAHVPGDARLYVESTIALKADDFAEPDLAIWDRRHLSEEVVPGDILLVIEVAVSSLPYDLREKASRYARSGVRDYWVVDAVRRTIRVHRGPANGRYGEVREYRADQPVASFLLPNVSIRLDELD